MKRYYIKPKICSCDTFLVKLHPAPHMGRKQALTYNEVIDTIARQKNKRVWKFHVPSKPVVSLLALFERLRIPFPINAEQVLRLNENKDFSYAEAQKDFGFSPLAFEEGVRLELRRR